MARAPYNFIPAPGTVFFPDYADKISQDVPFRDGVCGKIRYRFTAHTPVFVRNGHVPGTEDNGFSSFEGRYFIPATSVKGCIRNVLKTISFGKLDTRYDRGYQVSDQPGFDLAEAMFGRASSRTSLRGRVQFSPCWADTVTKADDAYMNLIGPHPELHYLYGEEIEGSGKYTPKGRKRYVLKDSVRDMRHPLSGKTVSHIFPLGPGSVFEGEVVFFNLKPFELGALLSAMTFFGQEKGFYHQIGQGKPYGFGRLSLTLTGLETDAENRPALFRLEAVDYICRFVSFMEEHGFNLTEAPSVLELLTLCSYVSASADARFQYMGRNAETTPLPCLTELDGIPQAVFPDLGQLRASILKEEEAEREKVRLQEERKRAAQAELEAKAQRLADVKDWMAKGKALFESGRLQEAQSAYEQAAALWNADSSFFMDNADPEVFELRKVMSGHLEQIRKQLSPAEELPPLASVVDRLNSIPALVNQARKRLPLQPDDLGLVHDRILVILHGMKAKERKSVKWKLLDDLGLDAAMKDAWLREFNDVK